MHSALLLERQHFLIPNKLAIPQIFFSKPFLSFFIFGINFPVFSAVLRPQIRVIYIESVKRRARFEVPLDTLDRILIIFWVVLLLIFGIELFLALFFFEVCSDLVVWPNS